MSIDVYNLIHKAQREHLFKLSIKIAKTDFSNIPKIRELKKELHAIILHITKHAEHEEQFIHPYYQNFPEQGSLLESQHIELEHELAVLKATLESSDFQDKIYYLFNRFLAHYLLHIDEEERIQREILWQFFTDEELAQVHLRFKENLTLEEHIQNMEFMLPCLNIHEVTRVFDSMKNSAPEIILEKMKNILQASFSSLELQKIS